VASCLHHFDVTVDSAIVAEEVSDLVQFELMLGDLELQEFKCLESFFGGLLQLVPMLHLLEEAQNVVDSLPCDNPLSLVFQVCDLLLQVEIQQLQLVHLVILGQIVSCSIKLHDYLEEVIQQLPIGIDYFILVLFV
jgi:hypothetical protein